MCTEYAQTGAVSAVKTVSAFKTLKNGRNGVWKEKLFPA
jgi:hypothetical protein